MARRKKEETVRRTPTGVMGLHGSVEEQPITETLEVNYMPYAMSVIVSRAIPEIDGFKPSHRKLLYTMYKMGLLHGSRTKSANIVGQTMRLNPHGDAAIYDTMVRLSRGYGALLHPFVDSKGNFGKVFSRDMAYAASRYTEAKLDPICTELFRDMDFDTVDMVDNYDGTMQEPSLLPTVFPNVLVSANTGIAVGMASNICGFNLREVCETTIARMKDPNADLMDTLPAPDFPTGGQILLEKSQMRQIYETGRGSFKVRAKWRYKKEGNLIEIYEIPYTTTAEAILDKVAELIRLGKIREISDMRDETDLSGLKLTIDLKRGVDPEALMAKLFRSTTLMDSYPCNFNLLVDGMPRVLGVGEILDEWTKWRSECVRRRLRFQLGKKQEKLHLLQGLQMILLDIDKAISIIRHTERDADVIPNLMEGFGIDEIQAEFVAEIKLRNINREYILKRTAEIEELLKELAELQSILNSEAKLKKLIIKELEQVIKKYGQDRKTEIVDEWEAVDDGETQGPPEYPVTVFISQEGYLKKITPQSLRASGEQKFKEGDSLRFSAESNNKEEILVFTDQCQCYKAYLSDFDDSKASLLGDYLPTKLEFEPGETILDVVLPGDYSGFILFFYENGRVAKVPMSAYGTKSKRKRLTAAYSDKSPLKTILPMKEDGEVAAYATDGHALIFSTEQLLPKVTRSTQGVAVLTLRRKAQLDRAILLDQCDILVQKRYRAKSLPSAGAIVHAEDLGENQLSLTMDGNNWGETQ